MKKYVKPELYYENFELSHTIANCAFALKHAEYDCSYNIGVGTIFVKDGGTCTMDASEVGDGYYCVYTPDSTNNLFAS